MYAKFFEHLTPNSFSRTLQQLMPEAISNAQKPSSTSTELDSVFSGLGLGQYVSPSHGGKSNGVEPKGPAAGPAGGRAAVMSPTPMMAPPPPRLVRDAIF